jgi:hypothetical protein
MYRGILPLSSFLPLFLSGILVSIRTYSGLGEKSIALSYRRAYA